MPRDNMASLIQRIARQACLTFRGSGGGRSSSDRGEAPGLEAPVPQGFPENLSKLKSLLTQVRAEDLNISPRKATLQPLRPNLPPVTYMHICETDGFSLGVFLLKSGTSIPLHDHPGMHGILKVLYGTVRISCMDKLEVGSGQRPRAPPPEQQFEPPLQPRERDAVQPGVLRSRAEYTEASGPCFLTPHRDNLHQIDAVDGPAAFLDILAPPYDPDDGRDCHYYRVLEPVRAKEASGSACDLPREVWLLETPQADDFWCEGSLIQVPRSSLEAAGARKRWAEHLPYSDLGLAGRYPITRAFFLPQSGRWIYWNGSSRFLGSLGKRGRLDCNHRARFWGRSRRGS